MPALIAIALSATSAIALGQGVRPHGMMTEIWMSGTGLELSRRVPQDRRLIHPDDNDQFAKSMLRLSQQHLDQGDQETAQWLIRCAHDLTNGRIGPEWSADILQSDFDSGTGARVAPVTAFANPVRDGVVWPPLHAEAFPPVSPAPIPVDESKAEGLAEPLVHVLPFQDSNGESRRKDEAPAETPVQEQLGSSLVLSAHHTEIDSATVPAVTENSVKSFSSDEVRLSRISATPGESTAGLIIVAVISFAAGAVFCVSLCAMLRLVPSRSTSTRRVEMPSQVERRTPERAIQTAETQDSSNWVVEEFYNKNVELYGQLAQTG